MEFLPVWTTAVTLLEPFIRKSGEAIAEKAGEALYTALESRFKKEKDSQAKKALKNYSTDPEIYRQALETVLKLRVQDPAFRDWLAQQVQELSGSTQPNAGQVKVEVKVSDHARVGDVIGQVGGDVVKGDKTNFQRK